MLTGQEVPMSWVSSQPKGKWQGAEGSQRKGGSFPEHCDAVGKLGTC